MSLRNLLLTSIIAALFQSLASKPEELRIGILVPIFKTEKNTPPFAYDSGGHNRFAGLYLAVQEINNKTDGHYDDLLPETNISFVLQDSKRDSGAAFFAAFDVTTQAYNGLGVHAVIGAASSGPSANVQLVCAEAEIPQISYSSSASSLSYDVEYPYFARTVASDDFQARVIVDLIFDNFGWSTITAISGTDLYSTAGIEAIKTSAFSKGLEVLDSKTFITGQNFEEDLLEINESGVRIIVIFAQAADGYEIIQQASSLGMFGIDTGFVWVFSDSMATSDFGTLDELYGADLTGTFYVESATPTGTSFDGYIERLQSLTSKLGNCTVNMRVDNCTCSNEVDADGSYLWIRDHDKDSSTTERCVGIDFPNDEVNTYNPYAYDATVLLAKAAHSLIESQDSNDIDGAELFEHLVNISYDGVTGFINLGDNEDNNEKGERLTGVGYSVKNYISTDEGLREIGTWTPEDAFTLNSEVEIAFPTSDNSQPPAIVAPVCQVGEVLPAGSQVCLTCDYGSFSLVAGETSCHDCPVGAVCHGGSHIKALRGYWRFPDSNGRCEDKYDDCSFVECLNSEACEGDILLSKQATLFLDTKVILLGTEIDSTGLDLLDEYCWSEDSYTSNCTIVVQGHSFSLANSANAIQNDEKKIILESLHADASIGPIADAEVYLSRPEECGEGYEGNLCAKCNVADDYGSQFGLFCSKCPEDLVATYFIALAGLVVVGAIAFTAIRMKLNRSDLKHANKISVMIKIFMSWGQLTTFFLGLSLNWPFAVEEFLEGEELIFNIGDKMISVDCIFNRYASVDEEEGTSETMVYDKLAFFLCLPIFVVLLACGIWLLLDLYRVKKIREKKWDLEYFKGLELEAETNDGYIDKDEIKATLKKLGQRCDEIRVLEVIRLSEMAKKEKKAIAVEDFQETYIKAVHQIHLGDAIMTNTILLFLLYPSVSLFSFRVFTCIELDDGRFFLEDDLSVECNTDIHTRFSVGIGIPAMLFYVLGIPCLMMYMVFRERKNLEKPHNMLRLGFLYEGYAQPYWWWEGWVMVRKFTSVILIVFTSQIGGQSAAVLVLSLLIVSFAAQVKCQPFGDVHDDDGDGNIWTYKKFKGLNRLEIFSLTSSMITLLCGLMFEGGQLSSGGLKFFIAVLFITNIAFVLYAFRQANREGIKKFKGFFGSKNIWKRDQSTTEKREIQSSNARGESQHSLGSNKNANAGPDSAELNDSQKEKDYHQNQ